jgi:hypothetical protein
MTKKFNDNFGKVAEHTSRTNLSSDTDNHVRRLDHGKYG